MPRLKQLVALLALMFALSRQSHISASASLLSPQSPQATARFVVFEAFMNPT